MSTTACIVQARMASTRFPGKVLASILGRPMLAHVVERARAIPGVDVVALTIPARGREEEALVWWGAQLGVSVYRTQEPLTETTNDVLGAYLTTARALKADIVVRVTGDEPLLDPWVAGDVVERVLSGRADFASNVQPLRSYPDGLDVEAFRTTVLTVAADSDDLYHREHVTAGMPGLFHHTGLDGLVAHAQDLSDIRWTVDVLSDLEKVRAIMAYLPEGRYRLEDTIQAAQAAGVWP